MFRTPPFEREVGFVFAKKKKIDDSDCSENTTSHHNLTMRPVLILEKRSSPFIVANDLFESYDRDVLLKLLSSQHLFESWSNCDNWALEQAKKLYKNEKEAIQKYFKKYRSDGEGSFVSYKTSRHGWGRPFPVRSLGFSGFRKPVRHTVATRYYDIDISNCQPSILYWSLKNNNLPVPQSLEEFVSKRDQILSDTSKILGCDRSQAKELFISLFFMGTYHGFRVRMQEKGTRVPEECPPCIKALSSDLHELAVNMKQKNPELYKVAYQKRKEKSEDTSLNFTMRTFLSLWCQTYEFNIVDSLLQMLHETTSLTKKNDDGKIYASYEFDGIKLLRENVDAYPGGLQQVLQMCGEFCVQKHGIPLRFEEKPMDKNFDLSQVTVNATVVNEPTSDDDLLRTMKLCCKNHRLAAEIVQEQTDGDYIYIRSRNEWYTWSGEEWEQSPHHFISQYHKYVKDYFEENISESTKTTPEYKDAMFKLEAILGNASYCTGVEKMAKTLFSTLTLDFDMNKDILNFNNGVLDIALKTFRPRRKDDYVKMTCGYDFFPYKLEKNATEDDLQYEKDIMKVLTQIQPDPQIFEFWMLCLSSGLSGRNLEVFLIYNGKGRNGKSLITDAMKINLGEYFGTVQPSVLTESPKNKSSGDANSAIANLDKKRYCICQEPPKHLPIQNSAMKQFTGGGEMQARQLYKESRSIQLDMTMGVECNSRPGLAEAAEDADFERIIDFLYGSKFTSDERKLNDSKHIYKKDPGLKDMNWWKLRRNSFMNLLVEKLFFLHDNNYDIKRFVPKAVALRTEQYCSESYLAHRIFQELYEFIEHMDDEDISIGKQKPGWDVDPALNQIVDNIYASESFYSQPAHVKQRKENSKESMKEYFRTSVMYEEYYYTKSRYQYLRGFRRKIMDHEKESVDDDSTAYDIETLSSHNL